MGAPKAPGVGIHQCHCPPAPHFSLGSCSKVLSMCREPAVCSGDRNEDVVPSHNRTWLQGCPKPLDPMERQTPAHCPNFGAPESFPGVSTPTLAVTLLSSALQAPPWRRIGVTGDTGQGLESALPWTLAHAVSPSSGDPQIHPFPAPPNSSPGFPEPSVTR